MGGQKKQSMNADLQNRSPRVEKLEDDRLRVTRIYDVLNSIPKSPAELIAKVWLPWGTADDVYIDCRLIDQTVEGQTGPFREPCGEPPILTRVYEQISANERTQVGRANISYDQYGNKTVVLEYLQFSAGTAVYTDIVGTSAAPAPNADCILKLYEAPNDGTLIRWKLNYINSGELSDTETLKFSGKLLIREITTIGIPPSTPSGYTLVAQSEEFSQGRTVFRYSYTNGSGGGGGGGTGGVISDDTQYNISPDQGTTGVTVRTIQYISSPSISVNPITPPAGFELIEVKYTDESGYRLWVATYAFGQGVISSDSEIKNGGKLVIYSITSINAVPATPTPTIGGTVTITQTNIRNGTDAADGTVIYEYQFAEGNGEISNDTDYSQSADNGVTGVTRVTIRALTAIADADPNTPPGGYATISTGFTLQDGYALWTLVAATGTGIVSNETETKNFGALKIYRQTQLSDAPDTVPTTPAATIGGTVTLISQEVRNADGYYMIVSVWAEGKGEVSSTQEIKNGGKLVIYEVQSLGVAPSTPASTIGGTVMLIGTSIRGDDGYQVFSNRYAEGNGVYATDVDYLQSSDEGVTGVTRTTFRALTDLGGTDPTTPPAGAALISSSAVEGDGVLQWTVVYASGTGTVVTEVQIKNGGKLVLYQVTALGAAPDAPSPTIGGTVTLTGTNVREDAGYQVFTYNYAEGNGQISVDVDYSQSADEGATGVTKTTFRALTDLSATDPTTAPSGTVKVSSSRVLQDGYALWTVAYAKGVGVVETTETGRDDFSIIYTVTELDDTDSTPAYPGGGTAALTGLTHEQASGYWINRATYLKMPPDTTFGKRVQFPIPGVASFSGTNLILTPPVTRNILADVAVTYATSQLSPTLWDIESYCSFYDVYTPTDTGIAQNTAQGLGGYVSTGYSLSSLGPGVYKGVPCDSYAAEISTSTPSAPPSGPTTLDADNDPYVTDINGTVYYRRTVTSFSF